MMANRCDGIREIHAAEPPCPEPNAVEVLSFMKDPNILGCNDIRSRSWVNGQLCQDGFVTQLFSIGEVLANWDGMEMGDNYLVMFGGPGPLLVGAFRRGRHWRLQLVVRDHNPLELIYDAAMRSH